MWNETVSENEEWSMKWINDPKTPKNDSNSSGCAFHPRVLHVGGSNVSTSCAPFSGPKASSTNYSSKTCSKPSANGELKYLPTPTFLINFPTNFILYIYKRKYVDPMCGGGVVV